MQSYITLNDGNTIPVLGLGVFMIRGNSKTERTCLKAIETGYRHIDTAHIYGNERGVGRAVKKCGLSRENIWITSKLWINEYGEAKSAKAIDKMLSRLDTEYIDLLLLHRQAYDYVGAWKALERALVAGKVKSIGLSNFEDARLEGFLESVDVKPSVMQVECHPYFRQTELKRRLEPYRIAVESWYPLAHGDRTLMREPVFEELSLKYGKSVVQIIIRWHIQEGNIVFPKSTDPEHLAANIDVFDFELTESEMSDINALDKNKRIYNWKAPKEK